MEHDMVMESENRYLFFDVGEEMMERAPYFRRVGIASRNGAFRPCERIANP
jgi:hypothetical protein